MDKARLDVPWCEFEQVDEQHVACRFCRRRLSGTPERYAGKIICTEHGPGTDFEQVLQRVAKILRMELKPCGRCKRLRKRMNEEGRQWCKENRLLIVAMAQYNAKAQGLRIPAPAIWAALRASEVLPLVPREDRRRESPA